MISYSQNTTQSKDSQKPAILSQQHKAKKKYMEQKKKLLSNHETSKLLKLWRRFFNYIQQLRKHYQFHL